MEENLISKKILNNLEALIFYFGAPTKYKKLSEILDIDEETLHKYLEELNTYYQNRGLKLVRNDDSVSIVTSEESYSIIEKIKKEELIKDLSKSALETLSIILYRAPIKRSDIDYIRGVNSQFILRILLVRGLIEKVVNPNDERGFLYKPTIDLLNHLGLSTISDVPEFVNVNTEIDSFIENNRSESDKQNHE